MTLSKCCGCVDLRTGAMIIAILEIIGGFSILGKSPILWDNVVTCIMCVASGACLLFGAIKYNWTATLVNLVFSAIGIALWIVVLIMFFVAVGVTGGQVSGYQAEGFATWSIITGVLLVAVIILQIYFWVCVYSFYRQLKSGNISSSSA